MAKVRQLARGIPGKQESPVLKELNDIRQILDAEARANGRVSQWDMNTQTKTNFNQIANAVLPEGKYTQEQIDEAFNELTLLDLIGGSENPAFKLVPTAAEQGQNASRFLLQYIEPEDTIRRINDNRSRESVAAAMFGNWSMLPVRDSKVRQNQMQSALEALIATTKGKDDDKGPIGLGPMGLAQLGNSGIRANLKAETPELRVAYTQNALDLARGWDRFSRDAIMNQITEFGHYVPVDKGGKDASSNGRMQAMSANKATRSSLSAEAATRAFGPNYFKNIKEIRKAGEIFAMAA